MLSLQCFSKPKFLENPVVFGTIISSDIGAPTPAATSEVQGIYRSLPLSPQITTEAALFRLRYTVSVDQNRSRNSDFTVHITLSVRTPRPTLRRRSGAILMELLL